MMLDITSAARKPGARVSSERAQPEEPALSKLRIVHLLNELAQLGNGIVNVAIDAAVEQSRAGHDVTVAAPDGAYAELLRANGVQHFLLEPSGGLHPLTAVFRLRRFLVSNATQIVHAHMMKGAVIGRLACTGTKARLVTTVHNSWQRHAVIMKLGHRVIAVSDAVRDDMISRGVPAARIETVLNGTIGTARRPAGTPPEPVTLEHPNIVTVAGMYMRKGIADLIEATALIRERVPNVKTYLLGDGPDRAHFEQLARERGVANSVVFLGFRADAELVMKQADVFVLASHADPNP
ncbi:MAG: glycosyltransferase, partial [Gemmatimonadota bacterium]